MRKKISKKQIGAVGMAAMMAVQTPAMAVETTKETPAQETTQETPIETSTEGVEVEETEASTESIQTVEVSTEEMQAAEEVVTEAEEVQETTITEETMLSTEPVEIKNVSEPAEVETEADIVALAAEEDGWHENSDGSRYYVKNGETLKDCVEKIGDSYYGFDGNGSLYSEGEFDIWNSETAKYDYYRAKEDGSLYGMSGIRQNRDQQKIVSIIMEKEEYDILDFIQSKESNIILANGAGSTQMRLLRQRMANFIIVMQTVLQQNYLRMVGPRLMESVST